MAITSIISKYDALKNLKLGYQLGGMTVAIIMASSGITCFLFIKEKSSLVPPKARQRSFRSPSGTSLTDVNVDMEVSASSRRNVTFKERTPSYNEMAKELDDKQEKYNKAIERRARESSISEDRSRTSSIVKPRFSEEFRLVLKNKAFLWLLMIWLCGPTAFAMLQSSLLLYCKYILGDASLISTFIAVVVARFCRSRCGFISARHVESEWLTTSERFRWLAA